MRAIDDLIDNYKTEHSFIADNDKELFISKIDAWSNALRDKQKNSLPQKKLIKTLDKYHIPLWTMETFAKSMKYDIYFDGFQTLDSFLEYTEGASIAPAAIFVHLCGIQRQNGLYYPPLYDIKKVASPCATFSYIVHIIRDFQKDQNNHLNYFADDLITKNGLTRSDLKEISEGGEINHGFRSLMNDYYLLADKYRLKTYEMIQEINPYLEPRYRLSLEIIFNLYLMVYERINIEHGKFTADELNPSADEIKERVYKTIVEFQDIN